MGIPRVLGCCTPLILGVGVLVVLIRGVSTTSATSPVMPDLTSPDAVVSTTSPRPQPLVHPHDVLVAAPTTVTVTAIRSADSTSDRSTPPASTPATDIKVTGIRIPAIAVTSRDVISVGLNPDQTLQVPSLAKVGQLGWYSGSPVPGEMVPEGPSVVLAHVDQKGRHGLFWDLHKLKAGDVAELDRSDGKTAVFRVTNSMTIPKDTFDQYKQVVYGVTSSGPQLRLITCSGLTAQEVVFADLVSLRPTVGS